MLKRFCLEKVRKIKTGILLFIVLVTIINKLLISSFQKYKSGDDIVRHYGDDMVFYSGPEISFEHFQYPLEIDLPSVVRQIQISKTSLYKEINVFKYNVTLTITKPFTNIVFVLFLVKSAPQNSHRRHAIRETWGNTTNHNIRIVFLLGDICNGTQVEKFNIFAEHRLYNDIVQFNFCDGYYNNTLKTTGGINWIVGNNLKSEFVVLTDDDYFVAINSLIPFLHEIPYRNRSELYTGFVNTGRPGRYSKWAISLTDYPYDHYPPFVAAGSVVMSMEFLRKVNIAIKFTKSFIFDDVFIGIVVYKLRVKPIPNNDRFTAFGCRYTDKCFRNVLSSHGYGDPKELMKAWNTHVNPPKPGFFYTA